MTTLIVIILLIIALYGIFNISGDLQEFCIIITVILLLVLIPVKLFCIYSVYFSGPAYMEQYDANQKTYQERATEYEEIIKSELSTYPKYEKDIFDSVDSPIILSYPEIRNDRILMEKVNQCLKLKDKVNDIKIQRNEGKSLIKMHKKMLLWF